MEDFASAAKDPISPASASAVQDASEDGCSICLEPFSADDPATVTCCNHEYHLQCILDWSQRSKECPICWQLLVLKDHHSQELLAAVEIERSLRSRHRSSSASTFPGMPLEDFEFHNVPSYTDSDESDLDERIMQQLAVSSIGRVHHLRRREQYGSPGLAHSQFLVFASPSNSSDGEQEQTTTVTECQGTGSCVSPEGDATVELQRASMLLSPEGMSSDAVDNRHTPLRPRIIARQTPPDSPQQSQSSELLSFSESLKLKLSAASSRYKESISKSTRGFKEKLLARNNSVKELSKEVQREVTASIAGVARMMERLDPTSKRVGSFTSVPSGTEGTSRSFPCGELVQEHLITSYKSDQGTGQETSSNRQIHASSTHSSGPEGLVGAAHVQDSR